MEYLLRYVEFWEELGPLPLDMIMASIDKGSFSRGVNIALIPLLLKKDKDHVDCSSYRLLSLLNADLICMRRCWPDAFRITC